MPRWTAMLSLVALVAASPGCAKKNRPSKQPDAEQPAADPMETLAAIPGEIESEINRVLQPIHDVDRAVELITTLPSRVGIDARGLTAMAAASLRDGKVEVALDLPEEARAEIQGLLELVVGIGKGVRETPRRAADAAKRIAGHGAKAVKLVTQVTAKIQVRLVSPFTPADERARLQAELQQVAQIDVEIKGVVGEAKATVVQLPARTTAALAKMTAALAMG